MSDQPDSNAERHVTRHVIVVGAGIVGICCALYLQRDGHRVTVVDPLPPGEGCSFGNAGILAIDHCLPESAPGMWKRVPGMLADPLGPLTLRWSYLPRLLPWLVRFLASGRSGPFAASAAALQALNQTAIPAFDPLLNDAGAQALVQRKGWMLVYESDRHFAQARAMKVGFRERMGIRLEVLDGPGVRELEPALSDSVRHGVYFPDVVHTVNPHRLVQVLAGDFQRRGGAIRTGTVQGFNLGEGGVTSLLIEGEALETDAVVLATGAHSGSLAAQLGSTVPLETMRGYHADLPQPGVTVKMPMISGDFHCAITPMEHGLRVGGTAEFAGLDAPPNYRRADRLMSVAKRLLPGLNEDGQTQWMGHRPLMADSLPVLGRSPFHPNVYFAFGHGSLGLTQGALTGKLIAEQVAGKPTSVDLTPYRADRF